MRVNSSQLIQEIAENLSLPLADVKSVVRELKKLIINHLLSGNQVSLPRIGTLYAAPARRPRPDGTYRMTPKLRPSAKGKKILSGELSGEEE